MPLTTPLLPLTVSASAVSPSSLARFPDSASLRLRDYPDDQFVSGSCSAASSDAPALAPSSSKSNPPAPSARPSTHSRRLTLSRFPLLRNGSRELYRSPSAHFKASSVSPTAPATGAPRTSSSIARGRDSSPTREHSADSHEADLATKEAGHQGQTARPRATKPDKMHQTSSRLLRMTDDERPYTRVSVFYCLQHQPQSVSKQLGAYQCTLGKWSNSS